MNAGRAGETAGARAPPQHLELLATTLKLFVTLRTLQIPILLKPESSASPGVLPEVVVRQLDARAEERAIQGGRAAHDALQAGNRRGYGTCDSL